MTPDTPRYTPFTLLTYGLILATLLSIGFLATSASAQMMIDRDSAQTDTPLEAFDPVTTALVDLNGDGVKEIITNNDNNNVYIFDGATGDLIAELETNHPDHWGARNIAGPGVGDLTGNGHYDIVITNSAGWVTAFEAQPTADANKLTFVKLWETYLDPHEQDPNYSENMAYGSWEGHPGLDGSPFLADAHGDGYDEVYVQLDDMPSLYKLTPSGDVEWWDDISDGNAGPLVGDLNNDGTLEAVYPSDGGDLHIYDAASMNHQCHWTAHAHGAWPASISVSPTLADVTGDGLLEIIFGVRNVYEDQDQDDWIERSHAYYFAVDASCNVVWEKNPDWSNPHVHMQPVPIDITGDGVNDIIFQDWNTIGHKPGNWEHTGPSNLFAVEGSTGDLLWRTELPNYWSNKNIAVADVTGDGEPEILANEVVHGDGISLYSLQGERKDFVAAPDGWVVTKGPIVEDLNGDGQLEVILPVHRSADHCEDPPDVGCREGALRIYTTSSTAEPIYSNAHTLNADETPTSTPTEPTQPSPDPDDDFDASFLNVRGNEWWVEVDVESQHAIDSVHVSIDGGSWTPLDETDWGSWATSTHIPDGSLIQLQARSGGDHAASDCYRWTDASQASCPTGPTGTFDASFLNVRGNEWWIETDVQADRGVTNVQVRVDDGSWASMSQTDWGSWATSVHAPSGSVVQFQATSSDGAQAQSSCYAWTDASETSCPGEGESGFDASFVNVRGNEWWVETEVESDQSVASVEARGDGGSWVALESTDWGSWALSTSVSEGTVVEFRAISGDGSTVISESYVWPP